MEGSASAGGPTLGLPGGTATTRRRRGRRGRAAVLAAWLILAIGATTTSAVSWDWRSSVRAQINRSFAATASEVADVVGSSLLRDGDLTAAASALAVTDPNQTNRQFRSWFDTVGLSRFPGSPRYGFVSRVPASGLAAFIARANADVWLDGRAGRFTLVPGGDRPYYCLARLGVWVQGVSSLPAGLDMCALPVIGPQLQASADTGQTALVSGSAVPLSEAQTAALAALFGMSVADLRRLDFGFTLFTPVYAGGGTPATVAERRQRLIGWTSGDFDPNKVLSAALTAPHPLAIRLFSRNPGAAALLVAQTGDPMTGLRQTIPIDADGQWLIEVTGQPSSWGPSATAQAALVLAVGLIVTLLLFTLVRVLASSRRRALALVEERTGQLRHQALHDSLTRLPNRALIVDRAEQMLARGRRSHEPVAALFVDLDNFKEINDTFGHGAGDELLMAVAARLSGALRDSDSIGRLGGDEFVVLAEGMSLSAGAELVAERLLDVLHEPFDLRASNGVTVNVSASIGVAVGDRGSAEELLRDADVALYEAKAAGRDRYVLFEQQMQVAVESRWALAMDLRAALDEGQFFLLYQPTFGITDIGTTGVEALLRWQHPTRGVVSPQDFVPLLEDTGLIVPVGRWVLAEACAQAVDWHHNGYPIQMSVNLSGRQLESDTVVADIADALAASGLEPEFLTVEITESTLMRDTDTSVARIADLKALGVRIAIDDFGTGYSSLAYLRRFPVDILKIDRSFISGMTDSKEAVALIHTLIQLGKTLGLETVAEGIEHQHQLDHLKQERCDTGQGFLIARPLPSDELPDYLANTVRNRQPAPLPLPQPG